MSNLPNRIVGSDPMKGLKGYVYGLKHRAQFHHCLGYGTWTIDFAAVQKLRKRYSKAVAPITYVPIYVKAAALAIAQNPEANSLLFKRPFGRRIVQFESVDVNLPIIRKLGEERITFIGTIRDAANKSLADIQTELTAYQRDPPEKSFALQRIQKFANMPLWLARLVHWWMTWSPEFYVKNVGTCGLTFAPQPATGTGSPGFIEADWFDHFFPTGPTTVAFCIGSVKKAAVVRDDEVVVRRVMNCSGMMDNFVLSGFAASQVARDFKLLLESGSFIEDEIRAA